MQQLGLLTTKILRQNGACIGQVHLFAKTFPNGFYPTQENFDKAARAGLSIYWAVQRLLHPNVRQLIVQRVADSYNDPNMRFVTFYERYGRAWMQVIENTTK